MKWNKAGSEVNGNRSKHFLRFITQLIVISIICDLFFCTAAFSQEWQVYWGDLHAHSSLSDGDGSPQEAYQYASSQCDFLALTEHNHQVDDNKMSSLVASSNGEFDHFVPLFGQEFSVLKGGNHLNVFNVFEPIPGAMNSDYKRLYSIWLPDYQLRHPDEVIVGQFNHPKSKHNDYGIAKVRGIDNYSSDWGAFVEDANRWIRLIAILNGPGSHSSGQHDLHADIKKSMINTWLFYLDKGMRLSPTCNHDTHVKSWCDLTEARTGVWIRGSLSKQNLLAALKEGRVFATEDQNLKVWFSINDQPMGSQLADMGNSDLELKIEITDSDEPASNYKAEIYRDLIHDDELAQKISEKNLSSGQPLTTTVRHEGGLHELYLVHVIQADENDDIDDAWTAPIYIGPGSSETDDVYTENSQQEEGSSEPASYLFVGSKRSEVYHYPSCKSVQMIKSSNRVEYAQTPANKRLHHGCPVE